MRENGFAAALRTAALVLVAVNAGAQALPILFDAPWIGFSTGAAASGFGPSPRCAGSTRYAIWNWRAIRDTFRT